MDGDAQHLLHDTESIHVQISSDGLTNAPQLASLDRSNEGLLGQTPVTLALGQTGVSTPQHSTGRLPQSLAEMSHPMADHTVVKRLRRDSRDSSDDDFEGESPPMGYSVDDANTDEFGFATRPSERADGSDLGGRPKDEKVDAHPAWSELKTKAGKERKRLPLACIACRRKKIRCSGEKPACKHCLRSRIPCVYKVNTRKASPRTDYMAMLDKRLKRMEERIIKVVPKAEQDSNVASVVRAVVKPTFPTALPPAKPSAKKRGAQEAFGPYLQAWSKAPAKPLGVDDHRPTSLQVQEAEETQLFNEGTDALPPKEIQEYLAEVFFDNIYGQAYHLLHKPSYMRKLRNDTLPPVLVLSVCAIAARFAVSPKLNQSTRNFLRGEEWASHARDICIRRYEWPNLTILTCLLILGLHEFGTCQGGRSWALGGQAIRMAFALQLHRDLDYDPCRRGKAQLSFVDREIRRRIMWACFLMDRFNSSGTDRPIFIREETVKIALPVKERNFQLDIPAPTETLDGRTVHQPMDGDMESLQAHNNMGVAAYMIRTIALWGRIITYMNQGGMQGDPHPMWDGDSGFAKLTRDAEQLLTSLPESLQYSAETLQVHVSENTSSQFLLLHIAMQQNMLFLYRSAVSSIHQRAGGDAPDAFLPHAVDRTYTAANRMSDIIRCSEESQYSVTAPFAGYCAFFATTVHILGIRSRDPQLKATAEANAGVNIKFLCKMMKYWGMFHWMVENIRSQYRSALDASRSGTPAVEGGAVPPILQYGDWFDRYPHGVANSEFMDPATAEEKEKGADGVLEQKPELQSVGEFFETISPPHSSDNKDAPRSQAKPKRIPSSRKSGAVAARAAQQLAESAISNPSPGHLAGQHPPNRKFSGVPGGRASGAIPLNPPLSLAPAQNPALGALSPISPVQMTQLSQSASVQQPFYSPDLLSMNLAQQSNGIMQPLERQLVFGGYSMDPSEIVGMQNMTNDMAGWDGAHDASAHVGMRGMKRTLDGAFPPGTESYVADPMDNFHREQQASSAWFMPFNMEPPDVNQDMNWGIGNPDSLGGVFGMGNEMATSQNQQLGGLGQGP